MTKKNPLQAHNQEDHGTPPDSVVVLYPFLKKSPYSINPEFRLDEAVGLARAINLNVVYAEVTSLREVRPATYLGKGLVETFKAIIGEVQADLVFIDTALTPVQQRNLEKGWGCKVIDRTALILEIFGARARTAEGVLQVELAALNYQKSRLVRSWTHLERQRGGLGFVGGPGETQLEVDRRLISDRIVRLTKELESVKRTRTLHRKSRNQVPYPVVALVGYTNAGKSTLFNRLTSSDVFAADLLFATLDPTLRKVRLKSGRDVILSDTVGFISDLPIQLIAAFRATLEEVLEADLVVHVRDYSHPETIKQKQDVLEVLTALGLKTVVEEEAYIEILNKIDLVDDQEALDGVTCSDVLPVSALTGEGVDAFLAYIEERLREKETSYEFTLDISDGAALSWLYENGSVLERKDQETQIDLRVILSSKNYKRFMARAVHTFEQERE